MPTFTDFDPDFADPTEWARMYRGVGMQVVPAMSHKENRQQWKRPALRTWRELENQLIPDFTFERWYGEDGEHARRNNMGLIAGACSSGIFVVDLDLHKDVRAQAWWDGVQHLQQAAGELETVEQATGGGGIQLFFRAPLGWVPPTCKTSIGVDIRGQGGFAMMPPSTHESGKSYRWKEGHEPWEMDIATAPQWLCDQITELAIEHGRSPSVSPLTVALGKTSSPDINVDSFGNIVDGREDYMTKLIWGILVGHRRDCPDELFGHSEKYMMEAFAIYERKVKSRLSGPESNAERLERESRGITLFRNKWRRAIAQWDTKLKDAADNPPDVLEFGVVELDPDGDAPTVESQTAERSERDTGHGSNACNSLNSKMQLPFPKHLEHPPGCVGEIASTILRQANRYLPPQTAIGAALAVLGHASQNKFLVGSRSTPLGLYVMAIAPTGAGKGDCMGTAMKLLRGSAAENGIHGAHASGAALHRALSILQSGGYRPCSLTIMDEIGLKLQQRSNAGDVHTGPMVTTLMELFGKGSSDLPAKTYADDKKNIGILRNPLVTILGFTTSEPLNKALTSGDAASGFANRFLLIETEGVEMRLKPDEEIFQTVPESISSLIKSLDDIDIGASGNAQPLIMTFDVSAKAIMEAFKHEADDVGVNGGLAGAIWTRAYQNAVAVAAILALGDCSSFAGSVGPTIKAIHAQYAVDLVRWSAESWVRRFGDEVADGPQEAERLKVLRIIREAKSLRMEGYDHLLKKGYMPHSLLLRRSRLTADTLVSHIKTLTISDQIVMEEVRVNGQRITKCYRMSKVR